MFAYVGSYTTPDRHGRGNGINVYRINAPDSPWVHVQHVEAFDNPSFLRISPDGRTLFAVHGGRDCLSVYRIDLVTGELTLINRAGTQGRNPVDLGFDPEGNYVVAAHYSSGTVSVQPIAPDGALSEPTQNLQLSGATGPNTAEQTGPLPHGVTPDPTGEFLVIPDKGLDKIFVFRFASGHLTQTDAASTAPGAGPRHAAFHPTQPILYVINELDCTVQVHRWQGGKLSVLQSVSALPPGATLGSGAEIAATEASVYASIRGHDSIARFSINPETGLLTLQDNTPIQGQEPRFFALDPTGRFLHVACQFTDEITTFRIDRTDGSLHDGKATVQVATPVTICFLQ